MLRKRDAEKIVKEAWLYEFRDGMWRPNLRSLAELLLMNQAATLLNVKRILTDAGDEAGIKAIERACRKDKIAATEAEVRMQMKPVQK